MRGPDAADDDRLELRAELEVRRARLRARSTAAAAISSSLTSCDLGRRLVPARELDEVVDEARELDRLRVQVADEPLALVGGELVGPAQDVDVRAQARERRAQLVRGVGDELALGAQRRLQRARAWR